MRRILTLALFLSVPASAAETITYAYDTQDRLIKVSRSGTVNNGVKACYAYDKADNRSNVTVVTSADCSQPTLSVSDVAATEGSPLAFVVTRFGNTSAATTVD